MVNFFFLSFMNRYILSILCNKQMGFFYKHISFNSQYQYAVHFLCLMSRKEKNETGRFTLISCIANIYTLWKTTIDASLINVYLLGSVGRTMKDSSITYRHKFWIYASLRVQIIWSIAMMRTDDRKKIVKVKVILISKIIPFEIYK